jgi:chondroitin AC lyase
MQDEAKFRLIDWGVGEHGETSFVGGVSDGVVGAAAFDFRRNGLSARKAWFFFDDQIFCLGTGITCDAADPVMTSVEQCWSHGTLITVELGQRILHGDTGYWFHPGQKMSAASETRTGAWNSINRSIPADQVETGDVFTCLLDHGRRPQGASCVYAVLPRTSESALKAFIPPKVIANESSIQAIWNESGKTGAAAFYSPGTVEFPNIGLIKLEAPGLVLVRHASQAVELFVADPTQTLAQITLHFSRGTDKKFVVDLPGGDLAGSTIKLDVS